MDDKSIKKDTFTDSRDGNTYATIKLGTQTWMAENLNYEAKGSVYYENDEANSAKYGRLYDWETAKQVCPVGWHLPKDEEWEELVNFVGAETAGKKLKSTNGWNGNGNGTDDFGFSSLPGGYGYSDDFFSNSGYGGYWWSATGIDAYHAWLRNMCYFLEYVNRYDGSKSSLFSVRCVQD